MWRENLQQHQKYVFQFIQRTNDKEAPIIFTYSYMVCFFVHVYSIHPSRISLMINVKSVVLLLDTKIYEAEEENHHSS